MTPTTPIGSPRPATKAAHPVNDTLERASRLLTAGTAADRIRTDLPHPARMYDYLLDGRDNYPPDRDAAEQALAYFPQLRAIAKANRAFLTRATRHLIRHHGIDQFLDLGAGRPGPDDVTTASRALLPAAAIVTVDNDPITVTHTRAHHHNDTRIAALLADLHHPDTILTHPDLHRVLDLTRPVGIIAASVLHYLPDADDPATVIRTLMDAVAPGSVLVLSHATADGSHHEQALQAAEVYRGTQTPITLRTRAQIGALCDGLRLVEPGVVAQPWLHADQPVDADLAVNWNYAATAVKP